MSEVDQAQEDLEVNEEDRLKVEDTAKPTTEEDGEQPPEVPAWNDDSGTLEVL